LILNEDWKKKDPIEYDPNMKSLLDDAEQEAETILAQNGQVKDRGYIRQFWNAK
jgi:hypothetical protein